MNQIKSTGTDAILWNNSPLDQRLHNDPNDTLTTAGNVTVGNYQNLPEFLTQKFPMLGTRDIGSSDANSVYLPEKTRVYLLSLRNWWYTYHYGQENGYHNTRDRISDIRHWSDKGYTGNYFGGYNDIRIFERTFDPGFYTFDAYYAYYLFTDPL